LSQTNVFLRFIFTSLPAWLAIVFMCNYRCLLITTKQKNSQGQRIRSGYSLLKKVEILKKGGPKAALFITD
ncbi:MAG: hypothetical protein WC306_04000, partial [Candidatus Paceibacterota bacterium]